MMSALSLVTNPRRLPPKLKVVLPSFIPEKLNKEQCGSLSAFSIETEKEIYTVYSLGAESSFLERPLIDETRILTEINTEQLYLKGVACLNDVDFVVTKV